MTDGAEQSVRSGLDNSYGPRSELLLNAYTEQFELPAIGRVLDYGCGKGTASRAVAKCLPGWVIDGYDLDDRAKSSLVNIPGFSILFTGDPAEISQRYDLIVLMHALEHIPDASGALTALSHLLNPGGRILVQVPNRAANPYDLLVADHVTHFDRGSLFSVARNADLSVEVLSEKWIVKELTLVARRDGNSIQQPVAVGLPASNQVDWLASVARSAAEAAAHKPFGIFGTSIIGVWLASGITGKPDFWIDEDSAKQGKLIDGIPVLAPDAAPSDATVLLAMAPMVGRAVSLRLAGLELTFVSIPPDP